MNRKNKIKAIVAFAVALAFLAPTSAVFANDEGTLQLLVQPEMSILPATQTVNVGNSFTVDVYIDTKDFSITGANVDLLSFDASIIQAEEVGDPPHASVTFNDFFGGASTFTMFGTVDNVAGTITGILEATIPYVPTSNAGTWITIDFTAIGYGTSPITMDIVGLGDQDGNPIDPITVINGEVIVEPIYHTLDITIEPSAGGTVTQVPLPDMSPNLYIEGTSVKLTPVPTDVTWLFKEWSGPDAAAIVDGNITMTKNMEVTAVFTGLGWEALLNFEAQISSSNTDTVVFGEDVGASDGIDDMDLVKPDAPPAPFIHAFLATSLPDPYDMLWEEYRFYNDMNDLQIFDLIVETDTAAGPETVLVTIAWDNTILSTETQYEHIGLYNVLSGDLLEDMKAVGTYVFTADSGMANHFQIICSDNHAPVAVPDSYETMEAHELIVVAPGVLANDYDVDGDLLTAVVPPETGVSNGILTLCTDGSFEYMPDLGFSGIDSFTYKANDGALDSNIVTVTIEVLQLNHINLQDGWNLISMPVGESIDKTDILVRYLSVDYTWADAILAGIILDPTFGWDGEMYTNELILVPGDGYWMWSYQDCELLIPSNAEADNHITNLDLGWNLVGIPYDTLLTKAEVNVYFNGELYSWADAVTAGIILDPLFDWDRTSQNYADTDTFMPGYGYWMYAYHGCALKKVV